ncbi:MAG: NAD-binding protein, partial [Gammaproteobacteria bacterium]|nr:NAD-binding protein [Gammaproteobacteria bacterium]
MQVLIVGAGDIGLELAKRLSQEKHDITMIEHDPHKMRRAREQLDALVIEGHGASYNALKKANVHGADVVAAMTNNDETNILA